MAQFSIFTVCNAGVGLMGPLEIQSLDSMKHILEVNLLGTIQTIQVFLSDMKAQGQGRILVTGSTGGLHGELNKQKRSYVNFFLKQLTSMFSQVFHLMKCTVPVSLQLREHARVWLFFCNTLISSEF